MSQGDLFDPDKLAFIREYIQPEAEPPEPEPEPEPDPMEGLVWTDRGWRLARDFRPEGTRRGEPPVKRGGASGAEELGW
jgi:hypothetical protein